MYHGQALTPKDISTWLPSIRREGASYVYWLVLSLAGSDAVLEDETDVPTRPTRVRYWHTSDLPRRPLSGRDQVQSGPRAHRIHP
jgi:hypothetical protein